MALVEVHEFGEKESPVILLLHALGMHWSMWQKVVDGLKNDYHILVPSLEGHEDENRTVFTTVAHNAKSVSGWLCKNGYKNIYAIIGVSLGGAVTIKLLSMETLHIQYAIIDAGIVPMGFNRLQEFKEISSNLILWAAAHSLKLIKLTGAFEQYGKDQMEKFNSMVKSMQWKSVINAFYAVDTYTLPNDLSDVQTKIAYWYGSLEEKERKAASERLKQSFPNITVSCFDGYNHAQMCLGSPDIYLTKIKKFIEK